MRQMEKQAGRSLPRTAMKYLPKGLPAAGGGQLRHGGE